MLHIIWYYIILHYILCISVCDGHNEMIHGQSQCLNNGTWNMFSIFPEFVGSPGVLHHPMPGLHG